MAHYPEITVPEMAKVLGMDEGRVRKLTQRAVYGGEVMEVRPGGARRWVFVNHWKDKIPPSCDPTTPLNDRPSIPCPDAL